MAGAAGIALFIFLCTSRIGIGKVNIKHTVYEKDLLVLGGGGGGGQKDGPKCGPYNPQNSKVQFYFGERILFDSGYSCLQDFVNMSDGSSKL